MAVWSRGGPSVRLAARLAARQTSLRLGWSVMSTAASSSDRTPGGDGSSAVVLSFRLFAVALASGILFMGVALFFILDAAAAPRRPASSRCWCSAWSTTWCSGPSARGPNHCRWARM